MQAPKPPYTLASLLAIMASLRNKDHGCPWDLEQTFETIAPYTIEEAYEVADAIDRGAMDDLRSELGDLLLQVVYHSQIAQERGHFSIDDVIASICDKMIARHPHVFDTATIASAKEQTGAWEAMKAAERAERGEQSALDGVSVALPALVRAAKLQRRAARVGFDWPDAEGPRAKISEELAECEEAVLSADSAALHHEIGDLLFSVTNWARHLGVDPELALKDCNRRFEQRFALMEAEAGSHNLTGRPIDELEQLWRRAKDRLHKDGAN